MTRTRFSGDVFRPPRKQEVQGMACSAFELAIRTQRQELRQAIDEDKWYLSERAGGDVGFRKAEEHFLRDFIEKWSMKWRNEWCAGRCPHRGQCAGWAAG